MGVRPPAGNDDEEPDAIEFGIAALDASLGDTEIDYPADRQTLIEHIGHLQVAYDAAGHTITVEEALAEVDEREFAHEQELLNALHPVFEAKREATSNSILTQLRTLVPF